MIAPVQLPPNEILRSIFRERAALDRTGRSHAIRDEISIVHASALYRTVLANRPRAVIEVGMAFGISTLAILTALEEAGGEGWRASNARACRIDTSWSSRRAISLCLICSPGIRESNLPTSMDGIPSITRCSISFIWTR
jgi:hypothetical protein